MPSKVKAGQAYVELSLNDKLSRSLDQDGKKMKAFGNGVEKIGVGIASVGTGIVTAFAGTAAVFAKTGDEVAKMAKRTGLSVEALSELKFVASQTGTEFGTVENAVRKMQRSIYDAGCGLSTQTEAL